MGNDSEPVAFVDYFFKPIDPHSELEQAVILAPYSKMPFVLDPEVITLARESYVSKPWVPQVSFEFIPWVQLPKCFENLQCAKHSANCISLKSLKKQFRR